MDPLLRALKHCTELLHHIEKIQTENDVRNIKKAFENIDKYLPGPITVQKLCKIDEDGFTSELIDTYSRTLSSVVKILLPHWPVLREEITNLFLLEQNFEVTQEILTLICGFLKHETDIKVIQALASILLMYLKSDCILTAVVDCSNVRLEEKTELYKRQHEWENYVQLLATLPQRVANKMERNTPKEFSHESVSFVLIFQIIRCIDFFAESSLHQRVTYDVSYLSHLLSKVVSNYNMGGSSEAILQFVDILICWTGEENTEQTKFLRKKLIEKLLFHMSRPAVDVLSTVLLKRCPLNYKNRDQSISDILADNIDQNKDWKHALLFKIPFTTTPRENSNTCLIENLVYYVSTSKKSDEVLSDLIERLCNVWSDVKTFNTISLDQHIFISQILVLSVKYRVLISKQKGEKWDGQKVKNILFRGISKHLDSLSAEFRTIGMATVEIVLNNLRVDEESNKEPDLKFDYSEMNESCRSIHKMLVDINARCLLDANINIPNTNVVKLNLKELLDSIAYKAAEEKERPKQNTLITSYVKTPIQTKEIVKTIIADKLNALERENKLLDEDDLDSDDDLQPYDMSNDLPSSAKKRPAYLRDLIEKINDATDFEDFEACLEVAEDLVHDQLKNEDSILATELLTLFIHLECKFSVDNFDSIQFNTAVAIVCSHPKECSEFLCKEFHTDVGRYSIATKILMLDVLIEAVNRIADVRPKTEGKKVVKDEIILKETEDDKNVPAEEVIRRRLISKTRYFHSKRPHPFSKAKANQFAAVSDSFFYPLVYGLGKKQLTLSYHNMKQDTDNILLLKYLAAIGNVILASKNCPKCPKYCAEIIEILMYLRYNSDPEIKMCVMTLITSIVVALPRSILKSEFFEPMMELRSWLGDCLSNVGFTMRLGAPKTQGVFAAQTLFWLEKALADDDDQLGL